MEFLSILFVVLPFVVALLAALLVAAAGGFALTRPWLMLLPFIVALCWFSESNYGRIDMGGGGLKLLSRGAGVLIFPLFLWCMLPVLAWARFGAAFRADPAAPRQPWLPLTPWFIGWTLLLLAHVGVALAIGEPLRHALAPSGFAYVVWIWVLVSVMVATVSRADDARKLALFILVMGVARALYGLVRFAAFGGDPANAYANRQGLSLKLTFFDINDSLLCVLTLCIALVMLYRAAPPQGWRPWQRAALWAAVVLPLLCIVLSFRRTAWIGTVLAVLFVLLQLPRRTRWRLVLLALPVLLAGIGYAARKRISQVSGPSGGFLYDIMPRAFGAESMRLLELKLAWQSLLDNPLFGVGSWGGYRGWQLISWQYDSGDGGGGAFLHSGVLHLALKTGLVGVVLLAGTIITLVLAWRRMRRTLPDAALPLAIAGFAGLLFSVPDWLLGTPVPQIRTMMLTGLCIGLPFVAQRCFARTARRAPAAARTADNARRAWPHDGFAAAAASGAPRGVAPSVAVKLALKPSVPPGSPASGLAPR